MVMMIDPPEGWKYGFPKAIPDDVPDNEHLKWLVEQGYPQQLIDTLGKYFYCRYWDQSSEDVIFKETKED